MRKCLVSNTGPMIALGGIGKLEILKKLFTEVMIPRAVYNELTTGYSDIGAGREPFNVPNGSASRSFLKSRIPCWCECLIPERPLLCSLHLWTTEGPYSWTKKRPQNRR